MDANHASIDARIDEMQRSKRRRIEKAAETVKRHGAPFADSRTPFTVAHGGEICCESNVWQQHGYACKSPKKCATHEKKPDEEEEEECEECEAGCEEEDCECGCGLKKCWFRCYDPITEPIPDAVRAMLRDRDREISALEGQVTVWIERERTTRTRLDKEIRELKKKLKDIADIAK